MNMRSKNEIMKLYSKGGRQSDVVDKFNFDSYKKCKKELLSKKARSIVSRYKGRAGVYGKNYAPEFLSMYYSPLLTVLKQYFKDLSGKRVLEVGYGLPLFIMYLRSLGAHVMGIDIDPYIVGEDLHRMSIKKLNARFKQKHKNYFDAIVERITLSKLYDEEYFAKTGKHRFKDKRKILKNLHNLLRKRGLLILQDDRSSIFTEKELSTVGFKKVIRELPIIFRDKSKKYSEWNTLVVYQKI